MKAITITIEFVEDTGTNHSQVLQVMPGSLEMMENRAFRQEYRDSPYLPPTLIPGPTRFSLTGTLLEKPSA